MCTPLPVEGVKRGEFMITFTYIISDANGLHARNALQVARAAEGYQCRIQVSSGGKTANGKQVLSLIGLSARKGAELLFSMDGEDEAEAAAYLQAWVKEVI